MPTPVKELLIACLAYLDDCYLVSKTLMGMQIMLDDVVREISKVGLNFNQKKCKWIADNHSYPYDGGYHGRSLNVEGYLVPQSDSFVVLGSQICCDCTEQAPVLHRIKAGWACYRRWSKILESTASLESRAALWCKTVQRSLCWGMSTLRGDNFVSERLNFTQALMFRKMMRLKRRPGTNGLVEPWLDWQKRSLDRAYEALRQNNCTISSTIIEQRGNWSGHVGRFGLGPRPQHLLKQVLLIRSKGWWQLQQLYNNLNLNPVLHATRGKPYSWEDNVAYGSQWAVNSAYQEFWAPRV